MEQFKSKDVKCQKYIDDKFAPADVSIFSTSAYRKEHLSRTKD